MFAVSGALVASRKGLDVMAFMWFAVITGVGARPVRINLGEPGVFDLRPWVDRVQSIDAQYAGSWELPALGSVTAPTAVLIRPDGYVAWVGDLTQLRLTDALTTWFGPPTAA